MEVRQSRGCTNTERSFGSEARTLVSGVLGRRFPGSGMVLVGCSY